MILGSHDISTKSVRSRRVTEEVKSAMTMGHSNESGIGI